MNFQIFIYDKTNKYSMTNLGYNTLTDSGYHNSLNHSHIFAFATKSLGFAFVVGWPLALAQ